MELSNRKNKKKILTLTVSVLFSVGILWFLGNSLDWSRVAVVLQNISPIYILAWITVFIVVTSIRAIRWNFLFNSTERTKFMIRFDALNIGSMASMILPFRAGEFLRPLFYSKWAETSFGKAFASVVIERVFDVCGMFFIFFLFITKIPNIPPPVLLGSQALGLISLIIVTAMFVSYISPKFVSQILEYLAGKASLILPSRIIDPVLRLSLEFMAGLSGIGSFMQLLTILILTAVVWTMYAFSFQLLLLALSDPVTFDMATFSVGAVTCVFVGLFIAAPSAPGFFGTFHLGCVAALTHVFSYPEEFSFAYAILAHAIQLLCTIVLGCISLSFRGLNLKSISKA